MLNYKDLDENKVISMAKGGDNDAKEFIIKKYTPMVNKFVRQYTSGKSVNSELFNDLKSDGIYSILTSINTYDETRSKFVTYVYYNIRSSVQCGLRQTMKSFKNGETSLDREINEGSEDASMTLYDKIQDNTDIVGDYERREQLDEMWKVINEVCTPNEVETLKLLATDGLSYEDIAKLLGTTVSAVCCRRKRSFNKIQRRLGKLNK